MFMINGFRIRGHADAYCGSCGRIHADSLGPAFCARIQRCALQAGHASAVLPTTDQDRNSDAPAPLSSSLPALV